MYLIEVGEGVGVTFLAFQALKKATKKKHPIGSSYLCFTSQKKSVYQLKSFLALTNQTYTAPLIRARTVHTFCSEIYIHLGINLYSYSQMNKFNPYSINPLTKSRWPVVNMLKIPMTWSWSKLCSEPYIVHTAPSMFFYSDFISILS